MPRMQSAALSFVAMMPVMVSGSWKACCEGAKNAKKRAKAKHNMVVKEKTKTNFQLQTFQLKFDQSIQMLDAYREETKYQNEGRKNA